MPNDEQELNEWTGYGPVALRRHEARKAAYAAYPDGELMGAVEAAVESATAVTLTRQLIDALIDAFPPGTFRHEAEDIARVVLGAAGFEVKP